MKTFFALIFATALILVSYAAPEEALPPAQEILDKYLKAQGGKASLSKIHSMRIRGSIETKDSTVPFTLIRKQPNRVRLVLHYPQGNFVMAYDGTRVWKRLAGDTDTHAQIVQGKEAALFKLNAPFFGYLLEPEQYGLTLKAVSWGTLNGKNIYKIQAQLADGMQVDYAIDPETFHMLSMTTYESSNDTQVTRNSLFSDFRPVGTLTEPYKTEVLENGNFDSTQTVNQFDLNPGILDSVFEYPQEATSLQVRRMDASNPSA